MAIKPKKPPKVESIIKGINKRLQQTAKVFGMFSQEYMDLQYLLQASLPDIFLKERKNTPTIISRSKTVISAISKSNKAERKLRTLYETIKSKPSLLQQAQTYSDLLGFKPSAKAIFKPTVTKKIRTLSAENAILNSTVPDYYDLIDELIDERQQTIARKKFSKVAGKKGEDAKETRDLAVEYVVKAIKKQAKRIKSGDWSKDVSPDETIIDTASTVQDLLGR